MLFEALISSGAGQDSMLAAEYRFPLGKRQEEEEKKEGEN